MTLPSFPTTVPGPSATTWDRSETPAFIRTSMDSGSVRQRQRFTRTPRTVKVEWRLRDTAKPGESTIQTVEMEAFGATLHRWTDWFTLALSTPTDPDATTPITVRFTAPPTTKRLDRGWWSYSATIETEPLP